MHCPFHTRTGGERQILPPPPPIFSRISKQRRRTAPPCLAYLLRILKKHLVWKSWTPRSKGQVTRSGQIRNITSAPASKFKIALWTQFESEWYQNFGVQYGHGLIQNAYPGFLNPRPAVGQNLPPPPLPDFRDNSKTVADIDTKFRASYSTSIWLRLFKFNWNLVKNVWTICGFVTSLQTISG